MKIENKKDGARGMFVAEIDGREAGEMTYFYANDKLIVIDHTNVEPGHEGKGVGTQMVLAAVDFARKTDCKIYPQCTFALGVFGKRKDIQDVMAP